MKKRYVAAGTAIGAIGGAIAWKMITRASEVRWEQAADVMHHPDHSHFVEVDGATVHYQEFGEKHHSTLILVHGYNASTYTWQKVAPKFAEQGFHVVALDMLGFGYSDKPSWFDYTITSQARLISRFMNRMGIGRAIVAGSSYGGAVSLTLALDYPEYVEKLILVDAVCNDEVKQRKDIKFLMTTGVGEVVSPWMLDSKTLVRKRVEDTIADENHHLITEDLINAIHRPLAAADAHNSVLKTMRNWHADRIEHDANLINQPTLIVWGEKDTVIPIHNGYKLQQLILNSRLVVFPNCGHVPHVERPDEFIDVAVEFCKTKKLKATDEEQTKLGITIE
jgi:pimeloyl-ACP methyl ester carboxylesterase